MDGHDLSSSKEAIIISPATNDIDKQSQPDPQSESQPDPEPREMKLVRFSFDGMDDSCFDDTHTRKKRVIWPNGASRTKWVVMDRRLGLSVDPEAAANKLWRKHEKRLKRAESKSENKDDPANPSEN